MFKFILKVLVLVLYNKVSESVINVNLTKEHNSSTTNAGHWIDNLELHPNSKEENSKEQVSLTKSEKDSEDIPLVISRFGKSESDHHLSYRPEYEESLELLCHKTTSIRKVERLNRTRTSKDGKMYVINKVVKGRKCKRWRTPKIQSRTFNMIPNLSSLITVPWMTKKSEDGEKGTGREFKNLRSAPKMDGNERIQTDGESANQNASTSNFDRFRKVLSLFTIVKFDNGDCFSNGLKGTCLHQIECQGKGGKPIGTCAKGYGICCYVERTCGERTRENCTYFVNDGFPKPSTTAPKICTLVVDKAHEEVEQLRLEFEIFELRGPNNGTCISDRFTVTGHNTNHVIPDICGINTNQHVYVDIDESNGPYNLNVITMGEDFPRTFQIKVTQIKKGDELLAPRNCLQYYREPTGVIQTFNYQYSELGNLPQAVPGYFNNMNYAICLKKHVGYCSVSYENEERENRENPTFQLLNTDAGGQRLLPPNQGGAEVFDCPDDYIIVNGVRLCGERLNDATIDPDYTRNYPVTDFSNGPFILQVRTNNAVSGRGFYLKYKQNLCLQ